MSRLEPATADFVNRLASQGGPPIYTLSPAEARRVLEGAQAGVELPEAAVEQRILPVGPTGRTPVRIVRPPDSSGTLPVIMYFHGGGWILGSFSTHERLVRELAIQTGAAVVFVEYEPSPEARFPTANEQAYAATEYVAMKGEDMGLDGSRLAVAGDSVGGNMTAAVTLMAQRRAGPSIRFQLLFYPVTDSALDTPSYQAFADGPWLTKAAMRWFWDAYAPDPAARADMLASPLRAPLDALRNLPPALVITDENDVLRDEGEAYAARLAEAGVEVVAVRYLGTIHDFVMLNGLRQTAASRSAISFAATHLRQALAEDRKRAHL